MDLFDNYLSYAVDSIHKWVVAAVTHCQPMARKEDDVYVPIPIKLSKMLKVLTKIRIHKSLLFYKVQF